jgi:hypothetical protein
VKPDGEVRSGPIYLPCNISASSVLVLMSWFGAIYVLYLCCISVRIRLIDVLYPSMLHLSMLCLCYICAISVLYLLCICPISVLYLCYIYCISVLYPSVLHLNYVYATSVVYLSYIYVLISISVLYLC